MPKFEVTFSVYRANEPGRATIGSSLTSNMKTVVESRNLGQAKAMIEAQYGKNCSVHGLKPL